MKFLSGDPTPARPTDLYAPLTFLWRYTIPFGLVLGIGLGLGIGAATNAFSYYLVKETVLGAVAGITMPLFLPLARRLVAGQGDSLLDLRHYLTFYIAGLGAGVCVFFANMLFPQVRPPFDLANLLYIFGTAGAAPLIGFFANAVWAQRSERNRTRLIFGQYVSEPIAQHALDGQTSATLEGETRRATVLISDIRGFTRMLNELGAETVVRTLNEYYTLMIDVIAQYDGTVNKFIGDAIVVLYNAPLAQPDMIERALATAHAMQAALRDLNAQRAQAQLPPLRVGIAVDVGDVVCGNIGSPKRLEYTAIGTPVNTAYQLASLAPSEAIYVTENVHAVLPQGTATSYVQRMELKGGTGTIDVYRIDPS